MLTTGVRSPSAMALPLILYGSLVSDAQIIFRWFNVFINLENILDYRQTSFGPSVFPNPTFHQPRFSEVYAPLEGRVFNVGFKLKLAEFIKYKDVKKDND
jgi:hypothetical protein